MSEIEMQPRHREDKDQKDQLREYPLIQNRVCIDGATDDLLKGPDDKLVDARSRYPTLGHVKAIAALSTNIDGKENEYVILDQYKEGQEEGRRVLLVSYDTQFNNAGERVPKTMQYIDLQEETKLFDGVVIVNVEFDFDNDLQPQVYIRRNADVPLAKGSATVYARGHSSYEDHQYGVERKIDSGFPYGIPVK